MAGSTCSRVASGNGIFPLDIVLGLTWDALSPWVMQWVARLATRMSFKAAKMVCQAVLNWAPATETIEQVVLGMGRDAAPFMKQLQGSQGRGRGAGHRGGRQMSADSHGGGTGQAARQAQAEAPEGLPVRLPAHRGKAKRQALRPQKTP